MTFDRVASGAGLARKGFAAGFMRAVYVCCGLDVWWMKYSASAVYYVHAIAWTVTRY